MSDLFENDVLGEHMDHLRMLWGHQNAPAGVVNPRTLEAVHALLAECVRLRSIRAAAAAVRRAQKVYYRERSRETLVASKERERELDRLLVW